MPVLQHDDKRCSFDVDAVVPADRVVAWPHHDGIGPGMRGLTCIGWCSIGEGVDADRTVLVEDREELCSLQSRQISLGVVERSSLCKRDRHGYSAVIRM